MYQCQNCKGILPSKPSYEHYWNSAKREYEYKDHICVFCGVSTKDIKSQSKKTIYVKSLEIYSFNRCLIVEDKDIKKFIQVFKECTNSEKIIIHNSLAASYGIAELTLKDNSKCKAYMNNSEMLRLRTDLDGEINQDLSIEYSYGHKWIVRYNNHTLSNIINMCKEKMSHIQSEVIHSDNSYTEVINI